MPAPSPSFQLPTMTPHSWSKRTVAAVRASSSRPASSATAWNTCSGSAEEATSVATRRSAACSSARRLAGHPADHTVTLSRSRLKESGQPHCASAACAGTIDSWPVVFSSSTTTRTSAARASTARDVMDSLSWPRPKPARAASTGEGATSPIWCIVDVQLPDIDGFEVAERLSRSTAGAR